MAQAHVDSYRIAHFKRGRPKKVYEPETISERETGMTPEQLAEKQATLKAQMYARMGIVRP